MSKAVIAFTRHSNLQITLHATINRKIAAFPAMSMPAMSITMAEFKGRIC